MMIILLLLLVLTPLSALSNANALGQKLPEGRASDYQIEESGDTTTLYKEGVAIEKKTISGDTIIVQNLESGEATTKKYEDGRLVKETGTGSVTDYEYDDEGRLSRVTTHTGDNLEKMTFFGYDVSSGKLASVEELSSSLRSFTPDSFTISNGTTEKYQKMGGMFVRTALKEGETMPYSIEEHEGEISTKRVQAGKIVVDTYDSEGNVVRQNVQENGKETVTENKYEGKQLVSRTVKSDGNEVTTEYQGGKEYKVTTMQDGVPQKETHFAPEGMKERVFYDGKPYAEVTYDRDNRNVTRVDYL